MQVRQIQQRLSLTGRYASALYREASATQQFEVITHDIAKFKELLNASDELATLLKSQLLLPKIAIAIFSDLEKIISLSETFLNFLRVIAKNRRLKFLTEIFESFTAIVDDASNTVPVKIEMVKIDKSHASVIEQMISSQYPLKNLKYSYLEVPELLGGFRVFINEQCLDYSLISRLNRLRYQLKEA